MDIILENCDKYFFTPYIYPKNWSEDFVFRQYISIYIIITLGSSILYLITASLSFQFVFDKRLMKHKLFLKNQVAREIKTSLGSLPFMGILGTFPFLIQVKGYSKLNDEPISLSSYGLMKQFWTISSFILFTDFFIYWIHRSLHHPLFYKALHKEHHTWKIPTPFASHAFSPIDGFLQSSPYYVYTFLFAMNKYLFLLSFLLVNVWTVSIHDGNFKVPKFLEYFINGSAHHTDHHLFYNFNYGQYTTLWDRIGKTFRSPSSFEEDPPLYSDLVKKSL